jgi:replicative DNA helicase
LVLDTTALTEYGDDITPGLWTDPMHKYVVGLILNMYTKLHTLPTKEAVLHELSVRRQKDFSVFKDLIDTIYSTNVKEVQEIYNPRLQDLIRETAYMGSAQVTLELLKKKDYDAVNKQWQKVLGVGSGRKGIDCLTDDAIESGLDPNVQLYGRKGHILTGYPSMDTMLKGGAASGELHVVVAPPNMGKSRFLTNLCVNAARQGKKVMRISAEMPDTMCREHFWQCMSGLSVEQIRTDTGKALIKQRATQLRDIGASYHVKEFEAYSATMNHIESYMIRTGEKWDMLVTDYMDLFVLAGDRTGNQWTDQTKLWGEGRRLARRLGCVHWSASQPVDVDEGQQIDLRKMGGSKGKGATVDGMWSINATAEEERNNLFRLFNGKNRFGKAREGFKFHVKPESLVVTEYNQIQMQMQQEMDKLNESGT